MRKILVFGSSLWGDCDEVKEFLEKNNIKHAYIDITKSMFNLKLFLKHRDNLQPFTSIKESSTVGIPAVIVDSIHVLFTVDDLVSFFD